MPTLTHILITLCVGAAAIMAWQSYGDAARQIIASSYPQAGWLAPRTAPIAYSAPGTTGLAAQAALSLDQPRLNAISLDLDAMRQTVDRIAVTQEQITRNVEKLTAGQERMTREISRLQAIEQHKNSEPPPRSARLRHANPLRNRRRHRRRADGESGPGDSHPISAMQLAGEQRRYLGRLAAERVREDKVLVAL